MIWFQSFYETFTKLRNAMPAKDLMFLMQQKQTNVLICNTKTYKQRIQKKTTKSSIKPFQTRNKRQTTNQTELYTCLEMFCVSLYTKINDNTKKIKNKKILKKKKYM